MKKWRDIRKKPKHTAQTVTVAEIEDDEDKNPTQTILTVASDLLSYSIGEDSALGQVAIEAAELLIHIEGLRLICDKCFGTAGSWEKDGPHDRWEPCTNCIDGKLSLEYMAAMARAFLDEGDKTNAGRPSG